jgi:two-component system chemotaxis response regulator CheB
MPESAILNNSVEHIARAIDIAGLLRQFAGQEVREEGVTATVSDNLEKEVEITKQQLESDELIEAVNQIGQLSMFTCPECQGALWEMKDGDLLRYRCHVGHAYSIDSLDAGQAEKVEAALWSALRALEERGALSRRLATQLREKEQVSLARRFEERAKEADEHAESLRQMLLADPERLAVPVR